MKSRYLLPLLLLLPAIYIAQNSTPAAPVTFRVIFGEGDSTPMRWDGTVTSSGSRIANIFLWREGSADRIDGTRGWKLSTAPSPPGTDQRLGKIAPKGVVITAEGADTRTRFDVTTPNGNFSFTPASASFTANFTALAGRVRVERVPAVGPIVKADGDQDNPAAAMSGDNIYLTYTEFSHSDRAAETRSLNGKAPANFDWLSRPSAGDQVKLIRYAKSQRKWSAPEDVSPRHEDVMRSAVAVDGAGRIWVIWSANRNNNFDLYARYSDKGKWSQEIRVTSDPGTDVNPVATTDSAGHVWIAWQAYRGTNLDILAAAQSGDKFTLEQRVSFSPASDWDPAIAASPKGEVAVTWDTYDKGDYDVYARVMRFGKSIEMEAPVPIAASANFEARSSAAYDGAGRLWVAYEASDEQWGKDFGVYDIKGVALYRGQTVHVRCLQAGRVYESQGPLERALKYAPGLTGREGAPSMRVSNPGIANVTVQGPRNSFPRLAADAGGRVYLTFRSGAGKHSTVGSIFHQFLTLYNGSEWTPTVEVPMTEGPVDMRATLLATAPGELLAVVVTDHRQATSRAVGEESTGGASQDLDRALVAATMRIGSPAITPALLAVDSTTVPKPSDETAEERKAIDITRKARLKLPSGEFQLMRGEFHRHTEFSADGGADGPLIDAYRYLIDAAGMDWGGCCDHDNGGGREYTGGWSRS